MPDTIDKATGEITDAPRSTTDIVTIKPEHLRAVQLFAARKDIRYYLNGMLVHVLDDGAVRLAATNGHAIAITHTPLGENEEQPLPLQMIVPIEVAALFAKHDCGDEEITIVPAPEGGSYRMEAPGLSVNFKPIDGRFPEYERVVPATTSGVPSQFDPTYLTLFGKASLVYSPKSRYMTIDHNGGEGAALVHVMSGEFLGVLMPCRMGLDGGLPKWITPKPPLAMPANDDDDDADVALPGIAPAEKPEKDDGPLATAGDAERLSDGDRKRKRGGKRTAPVDEQMA